MISFGLLLSVVIVLAECIPRRARMSDQWPDSASKAAASMFNEYWQMVLREDPELATAVGDHRFDGRLSCYSLKCFEKRKVIYSEFLEQANQILPTSEPGSNTETNLRLFIANLQFKMQRITSGSHLFPVTKLFSVDGSLLSLLKYLSPKDSKGYWDLIARYQAVPKQVDEKIELMREGIRINYTLHEISVPRKRSNWYSSSEESPYYKPFKKLPSTIAQEERYAIRGNASEAILNAVIPAFQKMEEFFDQEYIKHTRPGIGVDTLPNGRAFYESELAFHLSDFAATPEQVHETGLLEVQRISREMEEVIRSLGFNMTREEFTKYLHKDEKQQFNSEEEALDTYRSVLKSTIPAKLPQLFKTLPSTPLAVEKTPKSQTSGPQAYYTFPSPDGSNPGTFYLDTSSLDSLFRFDVITLAMHEGLPGHHMQISLLLEQPDLPEFRKFDLHINAYIEGWALYSEFLGYELGFYEDLYMRYGHLSYEIFRACRMVVDTGMHVFGWSRQKAIDFMQENSASALSHTEREVDRYISWPGQACSYKYGAIKFRHLRKKAEDSLGDAFDIKKFHEVVLNTNGPLEIVSEQVDRYLDSKKRVLQNKTIFKDKV